MSKYSYSPDIKPDAYRPPTREQIEGARHWYKEGFTVSRILARWDMALGTLYYWLDGGPFVEPTTDKSAVGVGAENAPLPASGEREKAAQELAGGGEAPAHNRLLDPIPRRKHVVGKRRRPLKGDRVSLSARLWRTAERQVRDIEERLSRPAASSPERERDVRMLASLIRAIRDLSAFDEDRAAEKAAGTAAPVERRPYTPEEVEALRASVVRKLQNIIEEQKDEATSAA